MQFFFNLAGAVHDPDNQGKELADMQAARIYAVVHASEVIRDHPNLVWSGTEVRVEVTDADRLVLFTVIVLGVDAPAGSRRD
jgi:hypothetical protein